MPTLLTYALNTNPNMLVQGTSDAVLILMATNNGTGDVNMHGISLTIPTGTYDNELTDYPSQIQQNIPAGWKVDTRLSPGNISFIFTSSQQTLPAGSNVTFTLSNINVNANQGTVELIVTEGSTGNPTLQLPVSKFPADWGMVTFSSTPSNLLAPGQVTLQWKGPSQANYTIQYMDTQAGQIYNLPEAGQAPFGNSGEYKGSEDSPLIINVTTFFTLTVTATFGGIIYQSQVTLPVSVYVPAPAITSFSYFMTSPPGGAPALNLVWSSTDADHMEGDWIDGNLDANVNAPLPVQVDAPFKNSYTITAVRTPERVDKTILIWNIITTIKVGNGFSSIAITPDGSAIFVTNLFDNNVSVIDTKKLQFIKNIGVTDTPLNLVVSPNGQYAAVSTFNIANQYNLRFIDVKDLQVINSIPVDIMGNVSITPDCNLVSVGSGIVVNKEDGSIHVVSESRGPGKLFPTLDGKSALGLDNRSVFVIDLQNFQLIKNIGFDTQPMDIAFTPDGKYAYVTSFTSPVTIIDLKQLTIIGTLDKALAPPAPGCIDISQDGKYALVSRNNYSNSNNFFSVINIADSSAPVLSFSTNDQNPYSVLISPDSTTGFIQTGGERTGHIWIYDFNEAMVKMVFPVPIPSNELGMVVMPDSEMLFVANGANVYVFRKGPMPAVD